MLQLDRHTQPPGVEDLVGKRVQIQSRTEHGSTKVLHGLTAIVVAVHPLAKHWVKLELEPNDITPHRDWSIHVDALVVAAEPG